MSAPARRAKVERTGADLSVRRQCALLNVARSGVYRPQPETCAEDLALMRRIDELYLEKRFCGSRRLTFDLNEEGRGVNRKRVQRLMRLMGLEGLVPRPGTSKAAPGNIDWASRAVLAWRLSNTMDSAFCVDAVEEALRRYGQPRISAQCGTHCRDNTDQGAQFTSAAFTGKLGGGRDCDLDGWARPLHEQHLHRAAVALNQI